MTYTRENPFISKIKERYALTKPGSGKNTQHIVLDLAGSGITYEVGDSLGVLPVNDPDVVAKTLESMQAVGSESITCRRSGEKWELKEYLSRKANLSTISKKFYKEISSRSGIVEDDVKSYLENRELWDFLLEHREAQMGIDELCALLMPLLPRLYSIASSQMVVGDEVHLTVAKVNYETNSHERLGVCTNYLCDLALVDQREIPVYIQPHKGFCLPEDLEAPVIMIGPGTGVAPYRAFMQERVAKGSKGKNWLFFGEWTRNYDFFYESYWEELQKSEILKIDVAFSRDQAHKVYVQHRMLENGEEFFRWIEEGAYVYVCGDAKRMAKDVDEALHTIVATHGKMSEENAKAYVKNLRSESRYLKDVY